MRWAQRVVGGIHSPGVWGWRWKRWRDSPEPFFANHMQPVLTRAGRTSRGEWENSSREWWTGELKSKQVVQDYEQSQQQVWERDSIGWEGAEQVGMCIIGKMTVKRLSKLSSCSFLKLNPKQTFYLCCIRQTLSSLKRLAMAGLRLTKNTYKWDAYKNAVWTTFTQCTPNEK